VVRGEQSRYEYAALCQYVIVFLESIIEPLIFLMKKNKFTYINTIVLLFQCTYNTEHAELNLFIWNMWQNRNTIHTSM